MSEVELLFVALAIPNVLALLTLIYLNWRSRKHPVAALRMRGIDQLSLTTGAVLIVILALNRRAGLGLSPDAIFITLILALALFEVPGITWLIQLYRYGNRRLSPTAIWRAGLRWVRRDRFGAK